MNHLLFTAPTVSWSCRSDGFTFYPWTVSNTVHLKRSALVKTYNSGYQASCAPLKRNMIPLTIFLKFPLTRLYWFSIPYVVWIKSAFSFNEDVSLIHEKKNKQTKQKSRFKDVKTPICKTMLMARHAFSWQKTLQEHLASGPTTATC